MSSPAALRAAGSSSFYLHHEVAAPGRGIREQGESPGELSWSPRISHTLHPGSAHPSLGLNHFCVQTPKLCPRVYIQLPRAPTAQIPRAAPSPAPSALCHPCCPSMPPSAPILLSLHQFCHPGPWAGSQLCHPQESRAPPGYPSGTPSWHLGRELGVPGSRGDSMFLPTVPGDSDTPGAPCLCA